MYVCACSFTPVAKTSTGKYPISILLSAGLKKVWAKKKKKGSGSVLMDLRKFENKKVSDKWLRLIF